MKPAYNTDTARNSRAVVSNTSGGRATIIAEPATIERTVVISHSSMGGSDSTLSVPMNGQADAPSTNLEIALSDSIARDVSRRPRVVRDAAGSTVLVDSSGEVVAVATPSASSRMKRALAKVTTPQWYAIGAVGLGVLLLARK